MITLVGTGHIFNINEQVSFIIKHIWPDAVLVELDVSRYKAMTDPEAESDETSKQYRKAAEYQKRMASERGTTSGSELVTAVNTGRMLGSEIMFIDTNASETLERAVKEMPFGERMRYRFSSFRDRFSRGSSPEETFKQFSDDEQGAMEALRKRFPTLFRVIIDERNEHMASQISEASQSYGNIVAVIGDGHVEGISKLLEGKQMRKIRLRELMNKERMDEIRSELWTHRSERNEG